MHLCYPLVYNDLKRLAARTLVTEADNELTGSKKKQVNNSCKKSN